jgi:recombination protein RecT
MEKVMSEQTAIVTTNYDKIRAMAHNDKVITSFAQIVGGRTNAQCYIGSALLAVANNKDLMECVPASVMSSALRAATLELSCDPALGQAHLVPFNDRKKGKVATLILGYRGIEQLALRTNKYRYIQTREIYEGQVIEEDQLTGATQIHGKSTSDNVIGYFNYFQLLNGFSHTLYMTVEELQDHGARYSKTFDYDTSKWKTDFPAMAKKTVLRLNLLRYGVLTTHDKAVLDAMADEGAALEGDVIDTTFESVDISEAEVKADAHPQSGKSAAQLQHEITGEPTPNNTVSRQPESIAKNSAVANSSPLPDANPQAEETTQQANGTKDAATETKSLEMAKKATRPFSPADLKATFVLSAVRHSGQALDPKDTQFVAATLNEVLASDGARHEFLRWITDGQTDSMKDLGPGSILALKGWLKPTYDKTSGKFIADPMAVKEATAAHLEAMRVMGQQELGL